MEVGNLEGPIEPGPIGQLGMQIGTTQNDLTRRCRESKAMSLGLGVGAAGAREDIGAYMLERGKKEGSDYLFVA